MARGELPALGRAFDKVLPKVRRDIEKKVLDKFSEAKDIQLVQRTLVQPFANAYLTGKQTGWIVHGTILGAPDSLNAREIRKWLEAAMAHGDLIANRFRRLLEAEPTVAELRQHVLKAGEQSVWQGQDDAAREVATLAEAEWKEWVRAWPRTEHRDWHDALEGVVIPEDHFFTLPGGKNAGAQVYGPRDWERVTDPGEWINCGHALAYHRDVTQADLEQTVQGLGTVYRPPTRSRVWASP